MIQSYNDLKVYSLSYYAAMEIFWLTKKFPKEEQFSLTDQIRRSSRSISANIVEGWSKRIYENVFKRHLVDAIGSNDETKLWLKFAFDCKYISDDEYNSLLAKLDEIGKMLNGLYENWTTYKKT